MLSSRHNKCISKSMYSLKYTQYIDAYIRILTSSWFNFMVCGNTNWNWNFSKFLSPEGMENSTSCIECEGVGRDWGSAAGLRQLPWLPYLNHTKCCLLSPHMWSISLTSTKSLCGLTVNSCQTPKHQWNSLRMQEVYSDKNCWQSKKVLDGWDM